MGVGKAMVVHGAGLDEVALHAPTKAVRLDHGQFEEVELTPEQAGLERSPMAEVVGGIPEVNAARMRALLDGDGGTAERDIVVLNAAALLMTAGTAADLKAGAAMAREALDTGKAGRVLDAYVETSRG
jgi:anthranilate phosphoribosyltransferase